ncbi:MAG: cardiolipin synthase [Thermodesulfobacteriota bacterium]
METEAYHWSYQLISTSLFLVDLAVRIGLSIRVIMRKRSHSVSLAWLLIILFLPLLGGIVYLLFGENRIGDRRAARAEESLEHYHQWLSTLNNNTSAKLDDIPPECFPILSQADSLVNIPTLGGNLLEIIENFDDIMAAILHDINESCSTCHLQFYIWREGGDADRVAEALIKASQRGVTCRILLDSIGSKDFLASPTATRMKEAGIKMVESLPAGLIKALFVRIDIRNHRKLVLIDGKIAYTGSQNMVDPALFKQNGNLGRWIDVMVRLQGPAVECLAGTFISDWFLDNDRDRPTSRSLDEDIEIIRKIADVTPGQAAGRTAVQVVPSGPGFTPEAIHNLLLTTIYTARKEIILTTPYFVPDESLLIALYSAGQRGVDVQIILPQNSDSHLAHWAARARFENLINSGVDIFLYNGGLLHSKTITVDGNFSLFGSVNLDMRSFWLNFETTLFIYNKDFTQKLRLLQKNYEKQSVTVNSSELAGKSWLVKFKENTSLLLGPLL